MVTKADEIMARVQKRKATTKTRASIYVDVELWQRFGAWCRANNASASTVVEEMIRLLLEEAEGKAP